ncbi:MAG: SIS domain-containing protein [bacterium]
MGYSGIIATDSNYKFMRIGMNCVSIESSHIMAMMASLMTEKDLVIAISHSGETEEIIKTVEIAKQSNAKVISITGNDSSRLENNSDVSLHYIAKETKLEIGSISSKLAQMFLIDMLYVEIIKKKLNKDALNKDALNKDALNKDVLNKEIIENEIKPISTRAVNLFK